MAFLSNKTLQIQSLYILYGFFFRNKNKKYVGYQVQDKNEYKNIWDRKVYKYKYKYSWFDMKKSEYKYTYKYSNFFLQILVSRKKRVDIKL